MAISMNAVPGADRRPAPAPDAGKDAVRQLESRKRQLESEIRQVRESKLDEESKQKKVSELEKQLAELEKQIQEMKGRTGEGPEASPSKKQGGSEKERFDRYSPFTPD